MFFLKLCLIISHLFVSYTKLIWRQLVLLPFCLAMVLIRAQEIAVRLWSKPLHHHTIAKAISLPMWNNQIKISFNINVCLKTLIYTFLIFRKKWCMLTCSLFGLHSMVVFGFDELYSLMLATSLEYGTLFFWFFPFAFYLYTK